MIALSVVTIITIFQVWFARRHGLTISEIVIAGIVGLVLGEAMDYILGYRMGIWAYSRHPYWQWSYWLVLPAMWTEFGIGVYAMWRLVRRWWLVTVILIVPYEVYGVIRHSWQYAAPWWLVVVGWFVMVGMIILTTSWSVGLLRIPRAVMIENEDVE